MPPIDHLFYPDSIAIAGITIANPTHWTRCFLDSLLEFDFKPPIYLVNPKGGEIRGMQVFRSLEDIPAPVDYVISTVPAKVSTELIKECARKGVRAIHFCTSGFSETGEEEGVKLESALSELSQRTGVRIIGPNCMGIYCPESAMSFSTLFPRDSGPVGIISQSGGNTSYLIRHSAVRGVRFSKVISYGNACDLDESDFLEYLTADSAIKVIALYIEGTKNGTRFRRALEKAAKEKVVLLLKGGVTQGGARAVAGHTSALAGDEVVWDSLCKQLGVIRVGSLWEMVNILVTLLYMPVPDGRNVVLIGGGGGASVLITDAFERRGLLVPPLPKEKIREILGFTSYAGNILKNPIDYGQYLTETDRVSKMIDIVSRWDEVNFAVKFYVPTMYSSITDLEKRMKPLVYFLTKSGTSPKPTSVVIEPGVLPRETEFYEQIVKQCVSAKLPVYYSFEDAALSIDLMLRYKESNPGKLGRLFHDVG
ncbi:MAG: CoA-binding protein [Deltaproteobacteria bacterium]|nr:CoA-binding protein [Deltaproteobacteria bacterium]